MTATSTAAVLENIYASIANGNAGLEAHIVDLKKALIAEGKKTATVDPKRLAMNNRQGRKLMQAFFRQRGVTVEFSE